VNFGTFFEFFKLLGQKVAIRGWDDKNKKKYSESTCKVASKTKNLCSEWAQIVHIVFELSRKTMENVGKKLSKPHKPTKKSPLEGRM